MDMSKYIFYTTKNKVIAVSTYAGKVVKGVAKCNPNDNFDLEKGKKLAAARCNLKVAKKRHNNAIKQLKEARIVLSKSYKRVDDMENYLYDAQISEIKANNLLEDILNSL